MSEEALPGRAIELEEWFRHRVGEKSTEFAGGPARLKVIVLLACVLALDSADRTTVGAIAATLEHNFHIGNPQIGLLVAVTTAIGAIATLPLGVLVDRIHRVRLVIAAIAVWSLAMIVSGFANSFLMLLFTRLALGAIVATAVPAVASLVGDFFRPGERARIYGYILTGELVGAAFGFIISGNVAAILSWRASFWVLALLGFILAVALWRWLPEPARGGQSRIEPGAEEILPAEDAEENAEGEAKRPNPDAGDEDDAVIEEVEEKGVSPLRGRVIEEDPARKSWWWAVRYVLGMRTNVILIIASALGYFYFTGIRTFAVVFLRAHFGLSQSDASSMLVAIGIGSIVGVLVSGRLADYLVERGDLPARVTIAAGAFLFAAALFLPGFFVPAFAFAAALFFFASLGLGATNPPLDAARLDIMHSSLWGRAESVRTALRFALEAIAPLAFGYVSTLFGGSGETFAGHGASAQGGVGLNYTFLVMLAPLIAAGLIMLMARKTYPRDVATAIASEEATAKAQA